jgi:hypothetical protein
VVVSRASTDGARGVPKAPCTARVTTSIAKFVDGTESGSPRDSDEANDQRFPLADGVGDSSTEKLQALEG